jgi:hypothetical protein
VALETIYFLLFELFERYSPCVNDGSGILFGFFCQKDTADSVLKRPTHTLLLNED